VNAVRLPAPGAAKQTSSTGAGSQNAGPQVVGSQSALSECVTRTVRRYLADIGDTECAEGLLALVLREVETPLLREVLAFHDGNQSRAASALGINRATLRKKLAAHGLL
jgi:Fis family transcriptional regulator, factor for inversion stimulation protein